MAAGVFNIELQEYSDFDLNVEYEDNCTPVVVTGYGAIFQVRNSPDEDPLLTASVSNGRISVAGTTGLFTINIPAASINAIKHTIEDCAQFAFVIWPGASTPNEDPKRILEGAVDYSRAYAVPS